MSQSLSSKDLEMDLETGLHGKPIALHAEEGSIAQRCMSKITTSSNGDIIHLGDQSFHRYELMNAFGGTLNPGIHPKPKNSSIGNPVPLGLATFSYCVLVISLIHAEVRGLSNTKILLGPSIFLGGLIELIAGVVALFVEGTFAAVVLGGYSGFWLSYGCILIDQFNIRSSYTDEEWRSAEGFFLTGWMILSFCLLLCTLKATVGFFLLFVGINLFVLMLTIGAFTGSTACKKAGGYLGIITSCIGWYNMYSGVASPENSYFPMKTFVMPHAPRV